MYVFLSFRDPKVNLNLGVILTESVSIEQAIDKTHLLGINPGGEVMAFEVDKNGEDVKSLQVDRLYSREEMLSLGYITTKNIKIN